jgi:hypothetical protein
MHSGAFQMYVYTKIIDFVDRPYFEGDIYFEVSLTIRLIKLIPIFTP